MPIEDITSGSTIATLDTANPITTDNVSEGDDHIRNLKKALQFTFPNISATASGVASEFAFAHKGGTVSGAATILGTLTTSGNAVFKGNLSVAGSTNLDGELSVSSTAVFGEVIINGRGSSASGGGRIQLLAASATGSFTRFEIDNFAGTFRVFNPGVPRFHISASGAAVFGNLTVSGATTLGNTLTVNGATHLNSTLSVSGATTIGGTLTANGAAHLKSTLSVGGAATFTGQVSIGGGNALNIGPIDSANEGGQIDLLPSSTTFSTVTLDNVQGNLRAIAGGAVRLSVKSAGSTEVLGNLSLSGAFVHKGISQDIVRAARFNASATAIWNPHNWSITHCAAGVYTITHRIGTTNLAFNVTPAILTGRGYAFVSGLTGDTAQITIFESSSSIQASHQFHVTVVANQ